MIEVTNLTKKYGNHVAVDHLTFRVEKGQIYGFLGPNGAGKSTTMNIITGYLAATEGTVTINGKDIQKEPEEAKKCIGYLPEQPPVYMDMTVGEYLKFAAELKKVEKSKRAEQIARVMEQTGVQEMKGRLIKNLSKGYRQRVGLAQALLGDPEVIILDEPTVGLDPRQIIEIRDLIRSLGKKHTVILSSHILSEVNAVCDQIMILSHGKLVASDTPEGLQERKKGSEQLKLEVKGTWEQVSTALSTISTIQSVENLGASVENLGNPAENSRNSVGNQGNSVDNCVQLLVQAKEKEDVREEVFYRLAEAHLPIFSMQLQTRSLEDIFLELTESEAADSAVAKGNAAEGAAASAGEAVAPTVDGTTAEASAENALETDETTAAASAADGKEEA